MLSYRIFFRLLLLLLIVPPVSAQTLYVPSGTSGVGSSSNSNVGVGTSAPSSQLQVVGTITAGPGGGSTAGVDYLYGHYGNGKIFTLGSQYSSAASFLGYAVKAQPGATGYLSSTGVTVGRSAFEANNSFLAFWTGAYQASTDGGSIEFSERMRIDSAGYVGIGTTAPATTLDVQGSYASLRIYGTATSDTAQIQLRNPSQIWQWIVDGSNSNKLILRDGGGNTAWAVDASRNVGIGTSNPDSKLQIDVATNKEIRAIVGASSALADLSISGPGFSFSRAHDGIDNISGIFTYSDSSGNNRLALATRDDLVFAVGGGSLYTAAPERMRITSSGNVGIGTTSPSHKLAVNGSIRAKEVIVDTGWSDYVFAKGYRLASLTEVERHIEQNGHLPGIPSAKEVAEHGVSVGEMQSKLLAKIEELTLHQITLEKENRALRERMTALEKKL